jgi:hypothetical protein
MTYFATTFSPHQHTPHSRALSHTNLPSTLLSGFPRSQHASRSLLSCVYLLENKAPFTIRISSTLVGYNSRAPSSQPTVIIRHRSGLQTERPVTEARRETRLRATRRNNRDHTDGLHRNTLFCSHGRDFPEPGVAPRDCHSKLRALRTGGFTRIRWALRPIQRARPPFACFVARGPSRVWLRHGSLPRSPRRPSG